MRNVILGEVRHLLYNLRHSDMTSFPMALFPAKSARACLVTENCFEDFKHCTQLFCPFTWLLENVWYGVCGRQCRCNLWILCERLKQDGGKLLTSLVGNLHQRVRRRKVVMTTVPRRMPCSPTKQVNYQILLLVRDLALVPSLTPGCRTPSKCYLNSKEDTQGALTRAIRKNNQWKKARL